MGKSYPDLDIAKLIMALLVVEIHTKPLFDLGSGLVDAVVSGIDCVAVPFFFIASGFLCFNSLSAADFGERVSAGSARVRSTIKRQLSLYATWTVILLPLALFGACLRDWGVLEAFAHLARGALLVGENDFAWSLWYLLANVVAFSLVYIMLRGGYLRGPSSWCRFPFSCWATPSSAWTDGEGLSSPSRPCSGGTSSCSARCATACSRGSSTWRSGCSSG